MITKILIKMLEDNKKSMKLVKEGGNKMPTEKGGPQQNRESCEIIDKKATQSNNKGGNVNA